MKGDCKTGLGTAALGFLVWNPRALSYFFIWYQINAVRIYLLLLNAERIYLEPNKCGAHLFGTFQMRTAFVEHAKTQWFTTGSCAGRSAGALFVDFPSFSGDAAISHAFCGNVLFSHRFLHGPGMRNAFSRYLKNAVRIFPVPTKRVPHFWTMRKRKGLL